MGRITKSSKAWWWIAATLFGIVVSGPLGNQIWNWPNIWPIAGFALIAAILIGTWRRSVENTEKKKAATAKSYRAQCEGTKQLREQFAICKPAEELRPIDLGFQVLDSGEEPDPRLRPYYPIYVPRLMVSANQPLPESSGSILTENELRELLIAGDGIVLQGPPTMGKSRTLYEVVAGLSDWTVVSPRRDRPTPLPQVFEKQFAGKQAMLLLEDLNDYAGAAVDLTTFCGQDCLGRAKRWVVAATCRDGPEMGVVRDSYSRSLRRFYDGIPVKLVLLAQSREEKTSLATSAGINWWVEEDADAFPTPGTIVMKDALVFMRGRFDDLPPDFRDVLRAIKLLVSAGVLPLSQVRVQATVSSVFGRPTTHLVDALTELAATAFLHGSGEQDPILPESAYLGDLVVPYGTNRSPNDDFPELLDALAAIGDANGVAMIGFTYAVSLENHALALEAYDRAIQLGQDDAFVRVNRAASLFALGRLDDALVDADAGVRQDQAIPEAFANRGAALGALGRPEEAISDLKKALELGAENPEIPISLASALTAVGRFEEALESINEVLRLAPNHAGALNVRGGLLIQLSRYDDALRDLDESIRLRPGNPKTRYNQGLALARLGRITEALEAFDETLNSNDESHHTVRDRFYTTFHRSMALAALGRHEEALRGFDEALELSPEDGPTLYERGVTLCDLDRFRDALADFTAALRMSPDDSKILNARDYAASKI